jgi:hypothetical protein
MLNLNINLGTTAQNYTGTGKITARKERGITGDGRSFIREPHFNSPSRHYGAVSKKEKAHAVNMQIQLQCSMIKVCFNFFLSTYTLTIFTNNNTFFFICNSSMYTLPA